MNRVAVPGRVNLIGEHIDYHGLPVLPIAIRQSVDVSFRVRPDRLIRASSASYGSREFEWTAGLKPTAAGDWENYIRAAAEVARGFLPEWNGIDAEVASDLPPAAGLSSSTALLVAFTLALLEANGCTPSFEQLMEVLPDGEQFVGTRGGGMDHAAVLGSRAGCASLIHFNPVSLRPIPIPDDWGFLVAHSMVTAEKSGSARQHYNERRQAGTRALHKLGLASYVGQAFRPTLDRPEVLSQVEYDSFQHVTGEAARVETAVNAMQTGDAATFGRLLLESHASLRDLLEVSCPALDRLVEAAMESGALGARLTGAGFGGCAVIFCRKPQVTEVRRQLIQRYYGGQTEHLLDADPSAGVLYAEKT